MRNKLAWYVLVVSWLHVAFAIMDSIYSFRFPADYYSDPLNVGYGGMLVFTGIFVSLPCFISSCRIIRRI